jgi:hypothetical protein
MDIKKIIASATAGAVIASQLMSGIVMAVSTTAYPAEWQEAVNFMKDHNLSSTADSVEQYVPLATVKREAAAKFFVNFAKNEFGKTVDATKVCNFTDLNEAQSWAVPFIVEACQMGLLKGSDGKFMP